MIWFSLIPLIALLVILGYMLYLSFLISKVSLTVPFPQSIHEPPPHKEQKFKFPTAEADMLEGKWIPSPQDSPNIILFCHELGADMNAWYKYAHFLPETGFDVFTFSFRKLSKRVEDGEAMTTGQWVTRSDIQDVLAAVRFLSRHPTFSRKKIGVLGISKGANAALGALRYTSKVKAMITDGAFSTTETVLDYIKKWVSIFVPYPWVYKNVPDWMYRMTIRFSLWISSVKLRCWFVKIERSLSRSKVPIFFIHGEADGYVSPRQAQYLFNIAGGQEDLWIVPKTKHNLAVTTSPQEYQQKTVAFFTETLNGRK